MIVTLVLQKFHYTLYQLTCFMSLRDFESSCHFYFKNSWNVSILTKLRHRFFLKYDEKILYNYNYVDFPLYIESAGNGSCHWVYVYIHVLLITESEHWCIDLARSINQGLSLRFPCNDQMDKVNKLFIKWPFYYGPEPAIN